MFNVSVGRVSPEREKNGEKTKIGQRSVQPRVRVTGGRQWTTGVGETQIRFVEHINRRGRLGSFEVRYMSEICSKLRPGQR